MTVTLAQARARVQSMLDDAAGVRWTATAGGEIDVALGTAQFQVMHCALAAGSSLFRSTANVSSTADGLVDLSSVAPMRLLGVVCVTGTTHRSPVLPVGAGGVRSLKTGAESLIVSYVPRPTFPGSDQTAFTWGGSSVSRPDMDAYLCTLAASDLLTKDGGGNIALEARKAELRALIESSIAIPTYSVMPIRSQGRGGAGFHYVVSAPDVLQLVYS